MKNLEEMRFQVGQVLVISHADDIIIGHVTRSGPRL